MAVSDNERKRLIAYLETRFSKEKAADLIQSLGSDEELQAMVRHLKQISDENASVDWENLKSPAREIFRHILHDSKQGKKRGGSPRAVRIFDSRVLPLPQGVRPATVDTRRVKYIAGEGVIDISLYPVSPESFELIGQVSGLDIDADAAIEASGTDAVLSASANECGVFRFPRIPRGAYTLRLKQGKRVLATLTIDV